MRILQVKSYLIGSKGHPFDIMSPVRIVSQVYACLGKFFYEFVRINDMLRNRH